MLGMATERSWADIPPEELDAEVERVLDDVKTTSEEKGRIIGRDEEREEIRRTYEGIRALIGALRSDDYDTEGGAMQNIMKTRGNMLALADDLDQNAIHSLLRKSSRGHDSGLVETTFIISAEVARALVGPDPYIVAQGSIGARTDTLTAVTVTPRVLVLGSESSQGRTAHLVFALGDYPRFPRYMTPPQGPSPMTS